MKNWNAKKGGPWLVELFRDAKLTLSWKGASASGFATVLLFIIVVLSLLY